MFLSPGQTRVLSAARSLVRMRGYAQVSLRQIAVEAGYSPAGLYAHFPGHGAILDALAAAVRAELAGHLERAAELEREPLAQLVAVGLAYINFALEQPAEFEVLFRCTHSRKQEQGEPTSVDLLRRIAREAAADARPEDIEVACLGLWSAAHGLATLRITHLAEEPGEWDVWSRRILRAQVEILHCGDL
jgi:AcrR family transcriptional regulator